jgi:hypothetical protein
MFLLGSGHEFGDRNSDFLCFLGKAHGEVTGKKVIFNGEYLRIRSFDGGGLEIATSTISKSEMKLI